MKKILGVTFFVLLVVCFVLNYSFAKNVISLGHTVSENSAYHEAALFFKDIVEKRTNGEVTVNIYPNSQLGWERDMLEGMQMGTIDMCISAVGPLASFVPKYEIFSFPFLFKNEDHVFWFYQSSMMEDINRSAEEYGFKVITFAGASFRIPFGKKFFEEPSDLKGIKIRLMGVPIHRETYSLLGADVTSTDFAELYNALQLGVVDAAENSYTPIYAMKFYETSPYITELPVFLGACALVMSKKSWDSFSEEQKNVLEEAGKETGNYYDEISLQMDEEAKTIMLEKGVKAFENVNLQPFISKVEPIYKKYITDEWMKNVINKIQDKAQDF